MAEINCDKLAQRFVDAVNIMTIHRNRNFRGFSYIKKEVSERQFVILCILFHEGTGTVSGLAKMMNLSKSTLSIIMAKMVKKGYIEKKYPNGDDDKRKLYFSVCDKGVKIIKAFKEARIERMRLIYGAMSIKQREYMELAFEKLTGEIDANYEHFGYTIDAHDDAVGRIIYSQTVFMDNFIRKTDEIIVEQFGGKNLYSSLTKNQCHLLICISAFKCNTITKLENYLGSSGSTVSITVSKLVKGGYVIKEHPGENDDGRLVYLKLSQKGVDALKDIEQRLKNVFFKYLSSFDKKSLESVSEGIELIFLALEGR